MPSLSAGLKFFSAMTTGIFICIALLSVGQILSAFGSAQDKKQLEAQIDQLKIALANAQGEARAALLAINELNSKK